MDSVGNHPEFDPRGMQRLDQLSCAGSWLARGQRFAHQRLYATLDVVIRNLNADLIADTPDAFERIDLDASFDGLNPNRAVEMSEFLAVDRVRRTAVLRCEPGEKTSGQVTHLEMEPLIALEKRVVKIDRYCSSQVHLRCRTPDPVQYLSQTRSIMHDGRGLSGASDDATKANRDGQVCEIMPPGGRLELRRRRARLPWHG